ncbi:MAG: 2,5-dichloro-2,5-cyclohexadiene-1,4-diol dehydrogenase [Sphingomonas sanxanigenens]|uniref:2,5-dichloro-2,5-cyclohexadiene-1,4-diol dehydrogenase n=1 Tax=Sphingomonas sanxanigenens TaxID=397260 RepID=A0A2W5A1F9_9SPHN|nr:MAG: 2,5-dichloro-2,5-cyclohexadiene-1,4-diol dehydrogenase [Sphingomonas sanxanigenens]
MRFNGKVAVVTGGASGIGKATALRFAAEGATVVVGDLDEAGGAALAESSGGKISFRRTDVTSEADIVALLKAAADLGGLDILFNNAGAGGQRARIDEIDVAGWDMTMALLLRSVALGIRHATPLMAARGGGAIVNTASIAALAAGAAPTPYSVAKAGVLHLTKVAAADLARYKIRVNAVCPGFITTNIFTSALGLDGAQRTRADAMIEGMAGQAQPIARAGRPEDIAAAVTFLASEDAGFMTGTHLLVDGGMGVGPRHSWDPQQPGLFDALAAMSSK